MITGALIGICVIAGIFLILTLAHVRDHVNAHGIHRITFRALTGRRTDGKRHTNASFWRKSDGIVTGHAVGRVSARHHRAGVSNLARILAWFTGTVISVWGVFHAFDLTLGIDSAILAVLLGWKFYILIIKLRRWHIGRTVITPMAEAMGPVLQLTGPETEELIKMEPDYRTKKHGVIGRIDIPARVALTPGELDTINHLISTRLPVGADLTPRMGGRAPHILIHAAPELPGMVKFGSYTAEIENLGPGKYLAGVTRSGDGYTAAFDGEEPHHGYCWNTGRGKTTILKSIIAQTFHNEPEATATIIDPKEVSLDAMRGIPGLYFYDDSSEFEQRVPGITQEDYEDYYPGMWNGVKSVYDLMNSRYAQIKADPTIEFPTHYLFMEEANSFAVMSRTWWQKNKPKGMQAATPPIWADYVAPLFWRGRQANIKIVLVAQSIQDRFLGGMNLRPSLGMVSLSGFRAAQWQTYVGTAPAPRSQKGRGRAIYASGESETWVQTLYGTDAELRAFAMANRTGRKFPVMGQVEPIVSERPDRENVTPLWAGQLETPARVAGGDRDGPALAG